MSKTIKIKRGNGTPPELQYGEPAFDNENKKLYVGSEDGTPIKIGGDGIGQQYIDNQGNIGGEIFNDYERNKAFSIGSHTEGGNNVAGGRGYKILSQIDLQDGTGIYNLRTVEGLEVGMEYSIRTGFSKPKAGSIVEISDNSIIVTNFQTIDLVDETKYPDDPNNFIARNYLMIVGHPELGDMDIGFNAHVEGEGCVAHDKCTHAEGYETQALAMFAHAEGQGTIASSTAQHVQGKFNIEDSSNKYAHIVGNGSTVNARSNAHTIDWDGNAWFAGNVTIGTEKNKLITEVDVVDKINNAVNNILYASSSEIGGMADNAIADSEGNNIVETYVKNIDYATYDKAGILSVGNGLIIENDKIHIDEATEVELEEKCECHRSITPDYIDTAVYYSTHQDMSDDYLVTNLKTSDKFEGTEGDLPVSYNAVKNYIDNSIQTAILDSWEVEV